MSLPMPRKPSPQPIDAVLQLRPYSNQSSNGCEAPGTPIDLKLDSNEGATRDLDLSPLFTGDTLVQYPSKSDLEEQIAERLDLSPAQVLVTCGADDALDRVCRAYLESGRELILPEPTFEMVRQYATIAGASILSVPWHDGPLSSRYRDSLRLLGNDADRHGIAK